jgi:hypothetical protein
MHHRHEEGGRRRARSHGAAVLALLGLLVALAGGCVTDGDTTEREPVGPGSPVSGGRNPTIPAPTVSGGTVPTTAPTAAPTPPTGAPGSTGSAPPAPPAPPGPPGPVDGVPAVPTAPASALLDGLVVATVDPALPDYRRAAFGDGWRYDPSTGCNIRELVLITESRTPPQMGERCRPLTGDWVSSYDGVATTDPADLEIDHLVPLAEAWRTGAASWTAERRAAFANDLDDPGTLAAVTSRSNRSKGDSAPDRWLPHDPEGRCPYVQAWVRVKARWGLRVAPAEKAVLVQVLAGC